MAYGQQRERSSNSFNYGVYHTLDSVSTSALGEEDSFFWPFFMLSSIEHPILGSKMSFQLLLACGFVFNWINFVDSTTSQCFPHWSVGTDKC